MRHLLQHNKKGISEIVGYVLLVLIAISLSSFVFFYLKTYLPKEKPVCPSDITLIIQDHSCLATQLNLTLLNKGLFSVDAAYVRVGPVGSKVKQLVNQNDLFFGVDPVTGAKGLIPGKSFSKIYTSQAITSGTIEIEVQPAVFTGKGDEVALCDKAVITQTINCS